jgi:hypothetical protein
VVLHLSKRALTHHCPLRILVLALQLLSLLLHALPPMLSVPPCWLPELLLPRALLLLLAAAPPVVWVPLSLLSTLLQSTSLPNLQASVPMPNPPTSLLQVATSAALLNMALQKRWWVPDGLLSQLPQQALIHHC